MKRGSYLAPLFSDVHLLPSLHLEASFHTRHLRQAGNPFIALSNSAALSVLANVSLCYSCHWQFDERSDQVVWGLF